MDLSIIIVSWNAQAFTRECLDSLRLAKENLSTEIIVVDNASSDGTAAIIRRHYPDVRLVENERNEGFARANNIGMRLATGHYLALINSDVNVSTDCLSKLHSFLEKNTRIGIAGPVMLATSGEGRRSCMRIPTLWSSFCRAIALDTVFKRSKVFAGFMMGDFDHDHTRDVDVLNGWFWMVRRQALEQVGLLDERFFMYGEDVDWCYRFRSAGWRVVFYANASAVHYGGASSANAPVRFFIEMQKANAQFWRKHHGSVSTLLYLLTQWLHLGLRMIGYAALSLVPTASRHVARDKVQRSFGALRWLATFKISPEYQAK